MTQIHRHAGSLKLAIHIKPLEPWFDAGEEEAAILAPLDRHFRKVVGDKVALLMLGLRPDQR